MKLRKAIAAGCVVACAGCSSNAPRIEPARVADRFRPVDLSVHPVSHVRVREDGTATVEAAIELVDADGFSVRGAGTLKLEFHQGDRHGEAIMSQQPWSIDLNDPNINADRFDPMTRTYLVPEVTAVESLPRSPHLTATLYRNGHEPLRDSMSLTVLGPSEAEEDAPLTP